MSILRIIVSLLEKLMRFSKETYKEMRENVGKYFWDVYANVNFSDGIGGHIIYCYGCGIQLNCREPDEIIKRMSDLLCYECMPSPLGRKKL